MAIKTFWNSIIKNKKTIISPKVQTAMIRGTIPVFSQFGEDIYYSDIVKDCIRTIAQEISTLELRHVVIDTKTDQVSLANSTVNTLFNFKPNKLMTPSDFKEKIIWNLFLKNNSFIYHQYKILNGKKVSTGFYPLDPIRVEFRQYENILTILFTFDSGEEFELPYEDVIFIKRDFSRSQLMGGDRDGRPNNRELLKVLGTYGKLTESLDKAVTSSLELKGVITVQSQMALDKLKKNKQEFEEILEDGKKGFSVLPLGVDFKEINLDPKLIDKDTLEFIEKRISNEYGLSLPILNGTFNESEYNAFYQKTLEPLIVKIEESFAISLFSESDFLNGNRIKGYSKLLQHTSYQTRISMVKEVAPTGAMQKNQILDLFGYPPFEGGEERVMSLNWINSGIANEYQLKKIDKKGGDKDD